MPPGDSADAYGYDDDHASPMPQTSINGMKTFTVNLSATYTCSLERAFKTPMLCDVTKVHTGLWLMPKVTHCTEEQNWGQPGGSKKIFVAPSLTQKGGEASVDRVLERIENQYWKIEVSDFKSWMLGFTKFTGEWKTTELEPRRIRIDYTYTLHAAHAWLYPFNWIFARLFWPRYMRQVIENIRRMTEQEEPYLYP